MPNTAACSGTEILLFSDAAAEANGEDTESAWFDGSRLHPDMFPHAGLSYSLTGWCPESLYAHWEGSLELVAVPTVTPEGETPFIFNHKEVGHFHRTGQTEEFTLCNAFAVTEEGLAGGFLPLVSGQLVVVPHSYQHNGNRVHTYRWGMVHAILLGRSAAGRYKASSEQMRVFVLCLCAKVEMSEISPALCYDRGIEYTGEFSRLLAEASGCHSVEGDLPMCLPRPTSEQSSALFRHFTWTFASLRHVRPERCCGVAATGAELLEHCKEEPLAPPCMAMKCMGDLAQFKFDAEGIPSVHAVQSRVKRATPSKHSFVQL